MQPDDTTRLYSKDMGKFDLFSRAEEVNISTKQSQTDETIKMSIAWQ